VGWSGHIREPVDIIRDAFEAGARWGIDKSLALRVGGEGIPPDALKKQASAYAHAAAATDSVAGPEYERAKFDLEVAGAPEFVARAGAALLAEGITTTFAKTIGGATFTRACDGEIVAVHVSNFEKHESEHKTLEELAHHLVTKIRSSFPPISSSAVETVVHVAGEPTRHTQSCTRCGLVLIDTTNTMVPEGSGPVRAFPVGGFVCIRGNGYWSNGTDAGPGERKCSAS